ncbi:phosphotransferase [Streptomyces sp. Z26]|uniref:phosphotransferase n=1 Tax=Streptomyces sp. Z26 TaxID=2500177 RepID=UPI000EF147C4|nr:phosphotransferase [Streptomyces sp. Z26]RLL67746.1 hypothetical protein D7M15_13860 [Streptomyces sp. Z26]
MKDRPEGIDEQDVRRALQDGWGLGRVTLAYAPVGFGDYHWTATDRAGRRWFVTVSDLALKPYCVHGPPVPDAPGSGERALSDAAFDGLRRAMDTVAALRDGGPDLAVAPRPDVRGGTVRRLGVRHALSVFPYVDGESGDFGRPRTAEERAAVLDLLAALHRAPAPSRTPVLRPELPDRAVLTAALDGPEPAPAPGHGPYAEPVRALLAEHAVRLRGRLREFDRRVVELRSRGAPLVVTHGEPHPGNVLRAGDRRLLVDWDTVGLAVPERDLWSVAATPDDLARYAEATGRTPDPRALELYALRWDLADLAEYVARFRAPHGDTPDAREAWADLSVVAARLAGA